MTDRAKQDYQRLLEQAGDDVEQEADDNLMDETIEQRLAALADGGPDGIGEAEQMAAAAEAPRTRGDGQIIGIAEQRSRPMTKQMIAFCQGIIEGKSRKQAYRDAYNNSTAQDATVSAAATKLMRDPRVRRMIEAGSEETAEALADDVQATRRYVSRALVALSKGGKQEGTRLRALELLGRTAGMFKDQTEQKAAPVTAEQLRKELAGHLRLMAVAGKKQA